MEAIPSPFALKSHSRAFMSNRAETAEAAIAPTATRDSIFAAIRRHVLLFCDYFAQYVKARVSYRGDFFVSLATSFAATMFSLAFVIVLFQKVPKLADWRFEEVLFLYGFSLIPYGLFNIVSLNLYDFGNTYIIEGKFDRVLLRPVSSMFQILFEAFRIESLQEVATGT